MSNDQMTSVGPDFAAGIPLQQLADGALVPGHVRGEPAILARRGGELFAVGAACTHYGGPLDQGLVVEDTVRCPWHHACFSLRTGAALRAPALNPLPCWRVEERNGMAYVRERIEAPPPRPDPQTSQASFVIVGGGAAGSAAAEMLRREGYSGSITLLSADDSPPYDRPNLSKNFLAGTAPEDWIPLRPADFYADQGIDLKLRARVMSIDTAARQVQLADGGGIAYDALLLATGAEPIRLDLPGGNLPHVHYLRSLADSRALVAKAAATRRAVVIGASFIGLEAAAALRARGIDVQVVGRGTVLMEKVLGAQVGAFVRVLHEHHGVRFHLGTTPARIDPQGVTLENGETVQADLVVIGVGVRPALALAEKAGLIIDKGIQVDEFLESSSPGVFAAGDIARWPDRLTGQRIRVEHWVVAQRQGQIAARNMLGRRERFDAIPFFWTEQYDFALAYIGHAEGWDKAEIEGQLEFDKRDCTITYSRNGKKQAVAVVRRDLAGLRAELDFEHLLAGTQEPMAKT